MFMIIVMAACVHALEPGVGESVPAAVLPGPDAAGIGLDDPPKAEIRRALRAAAAVQPQGPEALSISVGGPWDTPWFYPHLRVAAYQDGSVIFLRSSNGSEVTPYQIGRVDPATIAALAARAAAALRNAPQNISASDATDQDQTVIAVTIGGEKQWCSIYGLRSFGEVRGRVPADVVLLHAEILALQPADAVPWLPPDFEVAFSPRGAAISGIAEWPPDWPSPEERTGAQPMKVRFPIDHLADVRAFLGRLGPNDTVTVKGDSMAILWAALVMPE